MISIGEKIRIIQTRLRDNRRCAAAAARTAVVRTVLVFICIMNLTGISSYAAVWAAPSGDTTAEAAIVIDAQTKAVLWGKNIHTQYCPASITKLMTALVVLEKCSPDEVVTIAPEAVNGLESGAVTAGLSAGDTLTVEELLYAMLLRSANDAANALAVHASGSIEAFAEEMTSMAEAIGCRNTVFRNPSGLTSPENLTTAYDMALIGSECAQQPEFLKIEGEQSFRIGPTQKNPDGLTVRAEHKMIVKGTAYTDDRVIGGKTGYIKASGNTLVTIAESGGMRLTAVVLRDKNPDHYKDTAMMLDFGFNSFENYRLDDAAERFSVFERLFADRIVDKSKSLLSVVDTVVTLPVGADIKDTEVSYNYNLPENAPENAVALLNFKYADVNVGSAYVLNEYEAAVNIEVEDESPDSRGLRVSPAAVIIIAVIICCTVAAAVMLLIINGRRRSEQELRARITERRRQRLKELNVDEEEFRRLVEKKKNGRRQGEDCFRENP